jgi:membrane associated rhomboid family serine protease
MVKWLVLANAIVYLVMALLRATGSEIGSAATVILALKPSAVLHGWVWQVVTYTFIHSGFFHLLFNMLTLWMFGATLEQDWGSKRFREFYFFCGIGAALVTIAVSYTRVLGLSPDQWTVGASGAIYGILMAFGILHGDQEMFLFPLPVRIKAKYVVGILAFIALAGAIAPDAGGIANFAHLGGLFFGWIYVKFVPRRGMGFSFSERYYGLRNRYYRWKRARAARKFQVYMRKHQDDPKRQFFDEHGNYRGPDSDSSGNDRSPWVN